MFLLASLIALVSAQTLQIDSPTYAPQCQPLRLTWNGGSGPYYITVFPPGQPGSPLRSFAAVDAGVYAATWTVDIATGSYNLGINDANGAPAYSSTFSVAAGSSADCVSTSTVNSNFVPAGGSVNTVNTPTTGQTAQTSTTGNAGTTNTATTRATTTVPSTTAVRASTTTGTTTTASATGAALAHVVPAALAMLGAALAL